MKKRDWTPRRIGHTYCSPACGAGCTYDAYRKAQRNGKALLDMMETGGWEIDVWENMGWFYALRHPILEIGLHASGEWLGSEQTFFLSGPVSLIGNIPHMKDPNRLVEALMKHMRSELRRVENALNQLQAPK